MNNGGGLIAISSTINKILVLVVELKVVVALELEVVVSHELEVGTELKTVVFDSSTKEISTNVYQPESSSVLLFVSIFFFKKLSLNKLLLIPILNYQLNTNYKLRLCLN